MPVIDLLRHGETVRPQALLGRTDAPLSERGWEQVLRQTEGKSWDAIISSPLVRSRAAAERIAEAQGRPLTVDPDWRELDLGDWDGHDLEKLRADPATGERLALYYRDPETLAPPNGETYAALAERIARALASLSRRQESILVVAHAGSIRTALSLALGLPLSSLWALRIDCGTRVRLNLGDDAVHGLWGEITELVQP